MSAKKTDGSKPAKLDNIRLEKGTGELREYFYGLVVRNRKEAVKQINDEALQFPTLYLLREILERTGMMKCLKSNYFIALRMAYDIGIKNSKRIEHLIKDNSSTYEILKWMLTTGYTQDGLDNRYDEIMELTSAILVRYYSDTAILPFVAEMIFKRYRKGLLVHNLIWAFFEAKNPDSLLLIANRLYSNDRKDSELAVRLLGFIPGMDNSGYANKAKMYYDASQWIQENSMFLCHTGECLHLTANPIPFVLSQGAKYLCKPVSPENGRPFRDYSDDEEKLLSSFRTLDPVNRMKLAGFSYMLYRRSMHQWNDWIHLPLPEQVKTMRLAMGGRL